MIEKEIMLSMDLVKEKNYVLRGKRVMLDQDLAMLYKVETRSLNQAVKRNIERFPEAFMIVSIYRVPLLKMVLLCCPQF